MIEGVNYRVTTLIPGVQRVPRVMVAGYLGEDHDRGASIFNLRPHAGTQAVPYDHILSVDPTNDERHLPRKVRG